MPTILFIPRIPLPLSANRPATAKLPVCPDCGTSIDGADRNCAGCGRVIERSVAVAAGDPLPTKVLSPTPAGAWLILAILLVVVVGGPIYWWRQAPRPESDWQLKTRLQGEAETEMLKETTNVIVGLNRIIRSSINNNNADDNPYRWSGEVTAEFVNKVGGIERTNVYFKFGTDTATNGLVHLWCGSESEADRKNHQRDRRNR
jgi:hypothetical protein